MEEKKIGFLYTINSLASEKGVVMGRKKLMKVMFFIEHLNPNDFSLSKEGLLGNEFIIYNYGPFSFDVMEDFDYLKEKGLIEEVRPGLHYIIKTTERGETKLKENESKISREIKEKIDKLIEFVQDKSGWKLEKKSLEMLEIEGRKDLYKGTSVREIIDN